MASIVPDRVLLGPHDAANAQLVYRSVRTERWKYIHRTELQGMDELYDLRRDPFEMHNLIANAAVRGTVESLQADLQRRRQ